ncbi:MAG: helix-turn-helix transcriptional regulator [Actinomycetota bacterium]
MVESGQSSIRRVGFASRRHLDLPVEVLDHAELVSRFDPTHFVRPQRVEFHAVVLMYGDVGSHTVDFTDVAAAAGRMIQLRPGQVQRFQPEEDLQATIVLSKPTALGTPTWLPGYRPYCDLDPGSLLAADRIIEVLRHHQDDFDGDEPTSRMMVRLFEALVAVFDRVSATTAEQQLPEAYVAFRSAVEADFTQTHDVTDYASRLGYSARTLTRACQQVTGLTAKEVITDRLVLEAKRLLVHSDASVAAISHRLGFSEPTNFGKFFNRRAAMSPAEFRSTQRLGP